MKRKTSTRKNLAGLAGFAGLAGLGNNTSPVSVDDLRKRLADLDASYAAGEIPQAVYAAQKRVLDVRMQAMMGQDPQPPDGIIHSTASCLVSRVGGMIYIAFPKGAAPETVAAIGSQGFDATGRPNEYRAPFSLRRYVFALELCSGQESVDAGLDVDGVKNVIARYMADTKIGMDGLADDVRKAIGETQRVEIIPPSPMGDPQDATDIAKDIPILWEILDDIMLGNNVWLTGPAGSGKTYLAEKCAELLGRQYVTVNCNQFTSPTDLKGGPTIDGYQEGAMIMAWQEGKILILDELPKLDPNSAGVLNECLAKTKVRADNPRAVIRNGRNEEIKKSDGFGVIATGNVWPTSESIRYVGNNRQDASLLDRFSGSVYEISFNDRLDKRVAGKPLVYYVARRLRSFILEQRIEATISLRFIEAAAAAYTLEMERFSGKRPDKDRLDTGKTLRGCVASVMSTMSDLQRSNCEEWMKWREVFDTYRYRTMDASKDPFK